MHPRRGAGTRRRLLEDADQLRSDGILLVLKAGTTQREQAKRAAGPRRLIRPVTQVPSRAPER